MICSFLRRVHSGLHIQPESRAPARGGRGGLGDGGVQVPGGARQGGGVAGPQWSPHEDWGTRRRLLLQGRPLRVCLVKNKGQASRMSVILMDKDKDIYEDER